MGGRELLDPRDRGLPPTVAAAGPRIALSHFGRLELLHDLFGAIIVPPALVREAPRGDMPAGIVETSLTLPRAPLVRAEALGEVEPEVIALALVCASAEAVLSVERPQPRAEPGAARRRLGFGSVASCFGLSGRLCARRRTRQLVPCPVVGSAAGTGRPTAQRPLRLKDGPPERLRRPLPQAPVCLAARHPGSFRQPGCRLGSWVVVGF